MWAYTHSDELYHFGIKGMKWGVRRFQKKDGSLTAAGKKRYDDPNNAKKVKKTRYDKHYEELKSKGLSDEDASRIAKGRASTERTLITIGAIAATTAAAIAAYKFYDNRVDRYIKPGQNLQTVHKEAAKDRLKKGNPFYATYRKADNTIYSSTLFSHFNEDSKVTKFTTDKGIKVASARSGRKVFEELMKTDPKFRENVEKQVNPLGTLSGQKLYDRFNKKLVLRGGDHEVRNQAFYKALKKKGYGAVLDLNDAKLEGWTYNPIIIFDKQKKRVVDTARATDGFTTEKRFFQAYALSWCRGIMTKPVNDLSVGTAVGTALYAKNKSSKAKKDFVKSYMQQHPDTALTKKEIIKLYESKNK